MPDEYKRHQQLNNTSQDYCRVCVGLARKIWSQNYNTWEFLNSMLYFLNIDSVSGASVLLLLLSVHLHFNSITLPSFDFAVPSGGMMHIPLLCVLKTNHNNLHISVIKNKSG